MNTKNLCEKTKTELKKELYALLKEKSNLHMQKGMGEVSRSHLFKRVRHDIAQVKTFLREKDRSDGRE